MKWLGPVAVVVLAVLAEVTFGRMSGGPDFALFFGRFHPLVVHLPIGFFLLVAMGEAATFHPKLRDKVEPALGLLVPVSALAAVTAFLMGQLLALEGGFPAGALGWHRRLTLFAVMGMAACWVLFDRQREIGGQGRWAYRGVMGATLGLLSLGAHFGGTMTRGESYFSKYAPAPLKALLGSTEAEKQPAATGAAAKPAAPAADPLVYQDVLQPVLKQYCVDCHGPEKQKGKLRLDSLEQLMKGGENGAALVAGASKKSPLVARMLLPPADDDHMPPEGKPGPKPDAIELLQFWIDRGALSTLKVRDLLAPTVSRSLLAHALGGAPPSDSIPVSAPGAPAASASSTAEAAAGASATVAAAAPNVPTSPNAAAPNAAATTAASPTASDKPAAAEKTGAEPAAAAPAPVAGSSSGPGFLAAHCEKCHGAAKQKGKLRVDSVAALLKGGANGTALVPGSPDKSSIVQRVRLALSDEDHMPPAKEPQPSAAEIAVLASWIRAGAGGGSASSAVASKSPSSSNDSSGSSSVSAPAGASTTSASTSSGSTPSTSGVSAAQPAATSGDSAAQPAATSGDSAAHQPVATSDVSGPADPALLQSLPPQVELFSTAVEPLFREKCGKCHIREKPAGGLNVDEHAQLLEGGFSGPGVVAKDRKASFVMRRLVLPPANDEHMPPEGEPTLSADEVELIGAWIDQGAPAAGATKTAKLTAGAARALSVRGVKGDAHPQTFSAQAGGCAACSVPGAPQSKWLGLQALSLLLAAVSLLALRRHSRTAS